MVDPEQSYYDTVGDELARKFINRGLWARALAETGADDSRAKARYIALRVEQLKSEEEQEGPNTVEPEESPVPGEIGTPDLVVAPAMVEKPKSGGLWKTALPIFSICIILFCIPQLKWVPPDLGSLIGAAGPYSVLVWLIFHVIFTRGRSKAAWISFATIYVSFMVGAFISNKVEDYRAHKSLARIQANVSAVATNAEGGTPSFVHITPPPDTAPEYEKLFGRLMTTIAETRNQYFPERERLSGLALDPKRLKEAPDECLALAKQLKTNCAVYQANISGLLLRCREEIRRSDMHGSMKAAMLAGYDKSAAAVRPILDETSKLEADAITEVCEIVQLLATTKQWAYVDEKFTFSDNKELERFNGHIAKLNDLNKQYVASAAEMNQRTKELLKAFSDPTPAPGSPISSP